MTSRSDAPSLALIRGVWRPIEPSQRAAYAVIVWEIDGGAWHWRALDYDEPAPTREAAMSAVVRNLPCSVLARHVSSLVHDTATDDTCTAALVTALLELIR